eukprot:TRINITY_DN3870_c0_g2_i1.p1 TRINITY_DN3870_c0_g2~~TRINITY_DN3870_c0_g2_i1.p1  ORF type:complete len:639 (-),score=66.20 TRINITY_DN3870_c0_g2_i1:20-1936(-)
MIVTSYHYQDYCLFVGVEIAANGTMTEIWMANGFGLSQLTCPISMSASGVIYVLGSTMYAIDAVTGTSVPLNQNNYTPLFVIPLYPAMVYNNWTVVEESLPSTNQQAVQWTRIDSINLGSGKVPPPPDNSNLIIGDLRMLAAPIVDIFDWTFTLITGELIIRQVKDDTLYERARVPYNYALNFEPIKILPGTNLLFVLGANLKDGVTVVHTLRLVKTDANVWYKNHWIYIAGGIGLFLILALVIVGTAVVVKVRKSLLSRKHRYQRVVGINGIDDDVDIESRSINAGESDDVTRRLVATPFFRYVMAKSVKQKWYIPFRDLELSSELEDCGGGTVYRAKWRNCNVAVKAISVEDVSSESFAQSEQNENRRELQGKLLLREVEILSSMRHPNVVTFFGAAISRKLGVCLVTELCSRGPLQAVLRDHSISLSWRVMLKILEDTVNGMEYLHSFNPPILHRSLQSGSLLITDDFSVKISNFGLSSMTRNAARSRSLTDDSILESSLFSDEGLEDGDLAPHWLAPELIQTGEYSRQTDVYAFGIIMWEILTREQVYEGLTAQQILTQVVENVRPELPEWTPSEYATAVKACWHRNPRKRPTWQFLTGALRIAHLRPPAPLKGADRSRSKFQRARKLRRSRGL